MAVHMPVQRLEWNWLVGWAGPLYNPWREQTAKNGPTAIRARNVLSVERFLKSVPQIKGFALGFE